MLTMITMSMLRVMTMVGTKSGEEGGRHAPGDGSPTCHVLGDFYSYVVQCMLGLSALATLAYKRHVEKDPKRSFLIWSLDVSKQLFGAGVAHGWNLLFSVVFASVGASTEGGHHQSDECAFYFLNFTVDTVVGVFVSYALLLMLERVASDSCLGWTSLQTSGRYGDPPDIGVWLKQLLSWCLITSTMKLSLGALLLLLLDPLNRLGLAIFAPLRDRPDVELTLVMFIWPAILNMINVWIVDTFIRIVHDQGQSGEADKRSVWQRMPGAECCRCCCPVRDHHRHQSWIPGREGDDNNDNDVPQVLPPRLSTAHYDDHRGRRSEEVEEAGGLLGHGVYWSLDDIERRHEATHRSPRFVGSFREGNAKKGVAEEMNDVAAGSEYLLPQ